MAGPRAESYVGRGLAMVGVLTVIFIALFLGPRAAELTAKRVTVYADFRTITGLRQGSPVQISGVQVGTVAGVDFVEARYACDPLSEDIGRNGQGRTDSCDQDLFCSPSGMCAELESYAGKGHHTRCDDTSQCAQDEICFTGALARRETHLMWNGPRGVCARFRVDHTRTRVRLEVPADTVGLIRSDSRAIVAANSVLGDQMVNISSGRGDELCPLTRPEVPGYAYDTCLTNMRVQSRPSLGEDIDRLRKRVDSFMDKADLSIDAITNVIEELQEEQTMDHLKDTVNNLAKISRDVAYGEGLVGALLNSPQYRREIGLTLAALKRTSFGLERATGQGTRVAATLDRNIAPFLGDTEATIEGFNVLLADLDNPENRSIGAKLIRDDAGNISRDLEDIFGHTADLTESVAGIAEAVDDGEGTLGLLLKDDRVVTNLGKLLSFLADHKLWKRTALWYLDKRMGAITVENIKDSAPPP